MKIEREREREREREKVVNTCKMSCYCLIFTLLKLLQSNKMLNKKEYAQIYIYSCNDMFQI